MPRRRLFGAVCAWAAKEDVRVGPKGLYRDPTGAGQRVAIGL